MPPSPAEITLELQPRARLDVIDVTGRVAAATGDFLSRYRKTLYCSYHTTAGYLEQSLCARLNHSRDRLDSFIQTFREIFPPGADYEHDKLHLRIELSEEQRRKEPRNADSHLAFIGSGLRNCVTYRNRPDTPVYFIDLDGVNEHGARRRQTTVLGYNKDEVVEDVQLPVPVSSHPIDSVNLKDSRLGFFEQLEEMVRRHHITKGRVDIAVASDERQAGLTVNEYETLLMKNDLREVLKNPLWFMAEKGRSILRDPRAVPSKTINYAHYDLVKILNSLMDALGASESPLEKLITKCMAVPASRFLRLKRSVSFLVNDCEEEGAGSIVQGPYQSPILVQWAKAQGQARRVNVTLVRFG